MSSLKASQHLSPKLFLLKGKLSTTFLPKNLIFNPIPFVFLIHFPWFNHNYFTILFLDLGYSLSLHMHAHAIFMSFLFLIACLFIETLSSDSWNRVRRKWRRRHLNSRSLWRRPTAELTPMSRWLIILSMIRSSYPMWAFIFILFIPSFIWNSVSGN